MYTSIANHLPNLTIPPHSFKIRVPRTKGRFPPPCPPKWLLQDICHILKPQRPASPTTRSLDWDALETTLQTEIEDGIDNQDTVSQISRPHSVLATPRINSGVWKNKQRIRVGHKPLLSFERVDEHAKLVKV